MGDIFDDVKAMESAAEAVEDSEDANFNASELDDIMAEIDNLEKDFVAETTVAAKPVAPTPAAPAPAPEPIEVIAETVEETTPEVIEPEMLDELSNIVEEMPVEVVTEMIAAETMEPAPAPVESKVLAFEKKGTPTTDAKSNVTLTASGTMALNLTFKIGDQDATLVIDQEKGLLISFSGADISLHSEKGCSVQMSNGVSFSVPVQNGATATQKKSA